MAATFTIKLPVFEGPFDLLLFFIERDELDIYNIPIAKITKDFLEYIHEAKSMNIDLASEFIVVAATLMRIKAKLLLPRQQKDEEGNEIDPRQELVDRLLEYKSYKSVLEELRRLEELRAFMNPRGNSAQELKKLAEKALADAEMEDITLFKLLRVFQRVMLRFEDTSKKAKVHTVYSYAYTVQEQQEFIFSKINIFGKASFESVFENLENRIHALVTFLALLELLNMQKVSILQGEGVNNFWMTEYKNEPEPLKNYTESTDAENQNESKASPKRGRKKELYPDN